MGNDQENDDSSKVQDSESNIKSFIYSFTELLLNIYYMPGIVLGAGVIEWNIKKRILLKEKKLSYLGR